MNEDNEDEDIELATEVLKDQLELVDEPTKRSSARLKSLYKKPVNPKVYPKDQKRYELLPLNFKLPENGPVPTKPLAEGETYMHVDSGATVVCTNNEGELDQRMPTSFTCGTAASGGGSEVTGMGGFSFIATTMEGQSIGFQFHDTLEVPSFRR